MLPKLNQPIFAGFAFMKTIFKLSSIILVLLFVSVFALLFFLPKPTLLKAQNFSTLVFDEQEHLLRLTLSHDDKYRLFVPLDNISPQLRLATLLQEDQYFYQHFGLNPLALLQAGWQTYVIKSRRLGASTITMQLARIRFNINSKKIAGKLEQIFRSMQLERHYSKDDILEAYLNLAPYGNNIEGVAAASLIYFGKSVASLGLPEALTLAVIPQNPSHRTVKNPQLKAIRNKLYYRWLTQHPEDHDKEGLLNLPLVMRTLDSLPFIAPHFVNTVLNEADNNEHHIQTTLDLGLQRLVSHITQHYLARKKSIGAYNAAVLLVDSRDNSIKALMGSANFFDKSISGQINGAEIKRSPGSTLKPFIYGLALDQGLIHPGTVLKDVPRSFGSYNPENFDYDFMGPIRARDALVLSRNIPAIYLASQLANPSLHQLLEKAQVSKLRSESYYGLALSLGGAELTMRELTSLYLMLVNDGVWHGLRTRKEEPVDKGLRLLSPEASFLVLDMLKNTPRPDSGDQHITESSLAVSWKTGTSSGYRDAWSVGVFGPYVLTVWIGNFDNRSNPAFVGKSIAAPLFFELVDAIEKERGPLPRLAKYPERMNLAQVEVCKASGMLPTRYCQDTETTWFIPGKSPIKTDTIYREVAINKLTGLRACHFDENTRFDIYEFWSSDLLAIFKRAGIQRRSPPAFESDCKLNAHFGLSPQINSPQTDLSYVLRANAPEKEAEIPLTAVTDADVRLIYWFANESYLGQTAPDQALLWKASPGKFVIRVVDDHGRSDARDIRIRLEG